MGKTLPRVAERAPDPLGRLLAFLRGDSGHGSDIEIRNPLNDKVCFSIIDGVVKASPDDGTTAPARVMMRTPGVIVAWNGLIANIPPGYVLCDGTNGTPDMRSRFIYGAQIDDDVGDTMEFSTGGWDDYDNSWPPSVRLFWIQAVS